MKHLLHLLPQQASSSTDYTAYENSTLGIKIEVPSDWLYQGTNNSSVMFTTEKSLAQDTSNSSTYGATVGVIVSNKPNCASSDLDVVSQAAIEYLQQTTPSFHLISSNSTVLAGNPARQIVFTSLSYGSQAHDRFISDNRINNTGTSMEKYVKGFAQREISFVMEDFEYLREQKGLYLQNIF